LIYCGLAAAIASLLKNKIVLEDEKLIENILKIVSEFSKNGKS